MDEATRDLLRRLAEEGPKRFSAWDAPRFDAYCRAFLADAWDRLPEGRGSTFEGFAAMVQQGIGRGYLGADPGASPGNFLEFCLRVWLPDALAGLPAEQHSTLMARVWNLGEGLLREPAWVDGYVMSRSGELLGHDGPEAFLVDVLRPLLEPAPEARWGAPYLVTTMSLRQSDDDFLPGDMQLASPTVLVVSDRHRAVRLGIHLRRQGRSVVLGAFGPAGAFPDGPAGVDVAWEGDAARIGADVVRPPFLGRPFRWTLVRAGFLVASAPDSQKLWIIEAAA
jgi:hypothetical protein